MNSPSSTPMGYRLLRERHAIECLPHHVESFLLPQGARRTEVSADGRRTEYFTKLYWPGDSDFDHLEFALRHEGLHLGLLRVLLPKLDPAQITAYIQEKPTGANARRIWYLTETFTNSPLAIPNASRGNYVDLCDPQVYFTAESTRSPRHRINVNLLGTPFFSPIVRRTKTLETAGNSQLELRCRKVIEGIPPALYSRAIQYLYSTETKSSYAIERETPDLKRSQTFVAALREASERDYLTKDNLVALQQIIVDPRFANSAWRDTIQEQNYVSRTLAIGQEQFHFISPRPQDLQSLMDDFLEASRRLLNSEVHPVLTAAAIAYPFVFLHPFSDGNGRIHRFLIHYVLSQRRFAPEGVVFPISAIMLHHPKDYDRSLDSFSKLLLPLIDYQLDANGRMTVLNATDPFYRYIDCTLIAEVLFGFIEEMIDKELPSELRFLQQYDAARVAMQRVVDLPNRHADLFVRMCLQNKGHLSKGKRKLPEYAALSDKEIGGLEEAVRNAFELGEN